MNRTNLINTFSLLGECMRMWGSNSPESDFPPAIARRFYEPVNEEIEQLVHRNGWFTEDAVRKSFLQWGNTLTEEKIKNWLATVPEQKSSQTVGLILAGNIPLVGFHDIVATLLMGNKAIIKLSSDDQRIIPFLMEILVFIIPEMVTKIKFVEKLTETDAVIATGSDNTSRYFEKYFGHLPHIIRKNRTSVAVLSGDESKGELKALGEDIFTYYGLGCRNVSHLLLPAGYDLNKFFGAMVEYGTIINHHKYRNNYDYNKAIHLLNEDHIIENGFVLTKETEDLFAPISVLHYHFYTSKKDVSNYLVENKEKIQVVMGHDFTPFGKAQYPELSDYADHVNTLEFLSNL